MTLLYRLIFVVGWMALLSTAYVCSSEEYLSQITVTYDSVPANTIYTVYEGDPEDNVVVYKNADDPRTGKRQTYICSKCMRHIIVMESKNGHGWGTPEFSSTIEISLDSQFNYTFSMPYTEERTYTMDRFAFYPCPIHSNDGTYLTLGSVSLSSTWMNLDFDDSEWISSKSTVVSSLNSYYYVRHHFPTISHMLAYDLRIRCDNPFSIYMNGVEIAVPYSDQNYIYISTDYPTFTDQLAYYRIIIPNSYLSKDIQSDNVLAIEFSNPNQTYYLFSFSSFYVLTDTLSSLPISLPSIFYYPNVTCSSQESCSLISQLHNTYSLITSGYSFSASYHFPYNTYTYFNQYRIRLSHPMIDSIHVSWNIYTYDVVHNIIYLDIKKNILFSSTNQDIVFNVDHIKSIFDTVYIDLSADASKFAIYSITFYIANIDTPIAYLYYPTPVSISVGTSPVTLKPYNMGYTSFSSNESILPGISLSETNGYIIFNLFGDYPSNYIMNITAYDNQEMPIVVSVDITFNQCNTKTHFYASLIWNTEDSLADSFTLRNSLGDILYHSQTSYYEPNIYLCLPQDTLTLTIHHDNKKPPYYLDNSLDLKYRVNIYNFLSLDRFTMTNDKDTKYTIEYIFPLSRFNDVSAQRLYYSQGEYLEDYTYNARYSMSPFTNLSIPLTSTFYNFFVDLPPIVDTKKYLGFELRFLTYGGFVLFTEGEEYMRYNLDSNSLENASLKLNQTDGVWVTVSGPMSLLSSSHPYLILVCKNSLNYLYSTIKMDIIFRYISSSSSLMRVWDIDKTFNSRSSDIANLFDGTTDNIYESVKATESFTHNVIFQLNMNSYQYINEYCIMSNLSPSHQDPSVWTLYGANVPTIKSLQTDFFRTFYNKTKSSKVKAKISRSSLSSYNSLLTGDENVSYIKLHVAELIHFFYKNHKQCFYLTNPHQPYNQYKIVFSGFSSVYDGSLLQVTALEMYLQNFESIYDPDFKYNLNNITIYTPGSIPPIYCISEQFHNYSYSPNLDITIFNSNGYLLYFSLSIKQQNTYTITAYDLYNVQRTTTITFIEIPCENDHFPVTYTFTQNAYAYISFSLYEKSTHELLLWLPGLQDTRTYTYLICSTNQDYLLELEYGITEQTSLYVNVTTSFDTAKISELTIYNKHPIYSITYSYNYLITDSTLWTQSLDVPDYNTWYKQEGTLKNSWEASLYDKSTRYSNITLYLRTKITLSRSNQNVNYQLFFASLCGFVLYINGYEFLRLNLPDGSIDAYQYSLNSSRETQYLYATLPRYSKFMNNSELIVAAELHVFSLDKLYRGFHLYLNETSNESIRNIYGSFVLADEYTSNQAIFDILNSPIIDGNSTTVYPQTMSPFNKENVSYKISNSLMSNLLVSPAMLFDINGNETYISSIHCDNFYVIYDFGDNHYEYINKYSIKVGLTCNIRHPSSWSLEGSNDLLNWSLLHYINNAFFTMDGESRSFMISYNKPYRYFRFRTHECKNHNLNFSRDINCTLPNSEIIPFQMTYIRFYLTTEKPNCLSHSDAATNAYNYQYSYETCPPNYHGFKGSYCYNGQFISTINNCTEDHVTSFTYSSRIYQLALWEPVNSIIPDYLPDDFKCGIFPGLPAGLSIETNTGIISGHSLILFPATEYQVICKNDFNTIKGTITLQCSVSTLFLVLCIITSLLIIMSITFLILIRYTSTFDGLKLRFRISLQKKRKTEDKIHLVELTEIK